ncbi:MAG TPA: aryldialkylphosphatase, partial [Planctomycetota bacterium]|nr:aryldialkylphosphatase [Planctomycetota bacterium]
RLLLSHDAGWYTAGEEDGGKDRVRPFTALSDQLLPALEKAGVEASVIRGIVEENPWRAFQVGVRRR